MESYILTLLLLYIYVSLSFKYQIIQLLCTTVAYSQWDEYRKAWGININRFCGFIRMATVWSAPKREYDNAPDIIFPRWVGDTVSTGERD